MPSKNVNCIDCHDLQASGWWAGAGHPLWSRRSRCATTVHPSVVSLLHGSGGTAEPRLQDPLPQCQPIVPHTVVTCSNLTKFSEILRQHEHACRTIVQSPQFANRCLVRIPTLTTLAYPLLACRVDEGSGSGPPPVACTPGAVSNLVVKALNPTAIRCVVDK